jgi:hypothetical protein
MAKEESLVMSNKPNHLDDSKPLRVRRGRVESVDLYEIKDSELDSLEKGTPGELQLNFAVFLLSLAFAAVSSLFTATFPNKAIETLYIITTVVGLLGGLYLLIAWWGTKSTVKSLCKRIRERIPPDVQVDSGQEADSELQVLEDPDAMSPPRG